MDIRTGRTYETFEDAHADGVPESDIALVTPDGPSFMPPAKFKFTKGSFKPVAHPVTVEKA